MQLRAGVAKGVRAQGAHALGRGGVIEPTEALIGVAWLFIAFTLAARAYRFDR